MKHICIINYSSTASSYGIGTYLIEYVKCLRRDHKITIVNIGVCTRNYALKIKTDKSYSICTIDIPQLNTNNIDDLNIGVSRVLRHYIHDSKELIFHYHYFISEALIKSIKMHFPLAKNIYTVHYLYWSSILNGDILKYKYLLNTIKNNNVPKKYKDLAELYYKEKGLMNLVDAIICLSNDTYNLLSEYYITKKEKIFLISNGLSPKKTISNDSRILIRNKYGIRNNEKILLFVGRLNQIKGINALLGAFREIKKQMPKTRLVLIGDGDFNEIYSKCESIWTNVVLTGRISKNALCEWYCIADAAIFPSYYEECSYVGIEMMQFGLPIIASDGFNVKNMFDENNALIARIGMQRNQEEYVLNLTKSIRIMLDSLEVTEEKRSQSRRSFNRNYKLQFMQSKYNKLFENVTSEGGINANLSSSLSYNSVIIQE